MIGKNYAPEPAIKKNLNVKIQAYQRNCRKMKNKKERLVYANLSLSLDYNVFLYHGQQVGQLLHDARCIQMREPTNKRSKALSPVAPTMMRSTFVHLEYLLQVRF